VRTVLALAAVLLLAGCGGTHFSAHTGPPAADVSITSCALDPALHTGTVAGTITNSTGKTADYVVRIDFTDAGGAQLDSAMHAETGVGPGDKVHFKATGVETYSDKVGCRLTAVQRTPH
jgi:hypothetical protein